MTQEQWAKSVLKGLEKTKDIANRDQRSTARYWNGDDWGSISGSQDAAKWVNDQLVKYLLRSIRVIPK